MENLIFGIVTGSILLLGSVGFALTRRVENFLNIAHGQFLTIGAFIAWALNQTSGFSVFWAALVAIAVTAAIGYASGRFIFSPIRSHGPLMLLFTSVGLAYIIHGFIEAVWGVGMKTYAVSPPKMITIGGAPILNSLELAVLITAALSAVSLHLFLTRTKVGKAIRAMSSNFDLARIRGIDTEKMSLYLWALVAGLAALAGILNGLVSVIYTDMGWAQILLILSAAVLGGLGGSIYGVMIASLIVGLAMDLSVLVLPAAYRSAIAFAAVIVVLFIKPEGIFGKGGRAA